MDYIPFNYYTISLLLGGFTAIISGLIVFLHDRNRAENQAWFALTLCTAVWSFAYFAMTIAPDESKGLFANWILHYAAIFIPLFYFLLVLILTNRFQNYRFFFYLYTAFAFIFTLINLTPQFVVEVIPKVGFNYAPVPGKLYVLFFLYFVLLVTHGLLITWRTALSSTDPALRKRLILTSVFTIAASVGGGSVFATTFFSSTPPYLLILFSLYPAISTYGIMRYQLFDVKVVATQIFTFAVWIFILLRILLSGTPREQTMDAILLFVIIIIGTFLIRSVKKEVSQREHIEKLAQELQKANDRLRELDKQKSEFVSFANHQLRAPLAAMRGYASLLLEGDLGKIGPEAKEGVSRIFESTKTLVSIVDDYLNVSRIELGSMKYLFENIDLKTLVKDVVAELKPNIEKTKLTFKLMVNPPPDGAGRDYHIMADKDKLKQVFVNLIDNSLKYTPQGSVTVSLDFDAGRNKFIFRVSDTGIGIAPEILPNLFQKFTRATNANKVNIKGTGLGLYVAKEMIEAHHGTIRAESPGEGKGSTFVVELEPAAGHPL